MIAFALGHNGARLDCAEWMPDSDALSWSGEHTNETSGRFSRARTGGAHILIMIRAHLFVSLSLQISFSPLLLVRSFLMAIILISIIIICSLRHRCAAKPADQDEHVGANQHQRTPTRDLVRRATPHSRDNCTAFYTRKQQHNGLMMINLVLACRAEVS